MADFSESIAAAARQLTAEWRQTQAHWRDRTADYFEEIYLQSLLDETHSILIALDHLEQVLDSVDQLNV